MATAKWGFALMTLTVLLMFFTRCDGWAARYGVRGNKGRKREPQRILLDKYQVTSDDHDSQSVQYDNNREDYKDQTLPQKKYDTYDNLIVPEIYYRSGFDNYRLSYDNFRVNNNKPKASFSNHRAPYDNPEVSHRDNYKVADDNQLVPNVLEYYKDADFLVPGKRPRKRRMSN